MTFDKQVKEAKRKQLESRIVRDIVFLILGLIFLILSIFSAINDKNKEKNTEKKENIKTTLVTK